MKLSKLPAIAILAVASVAPAALYYDSGTLSVGATIPDGNPADPLVSTWNVTMPTGYELVGDLRLSVKLSGGFNGDLYAYLAHGNDVVVLLNRVGTTSSDPWGYSDAGMTVSLMAAGGTGYFTSLYGSSQGDIHTYRDVTGVQVPTGQWHADGGGLSTFLNQDGNGSWTIAFFDLATGPGQQSTLVDWRLEIHAVPEPINVALLVFGGLAGVVWGVRRYRGRVRSEPGSTWRLP